MLGCTEAFFKLQRASLEAKNTEIYFYIEFEKAGVDMTEPLHPVELSRTVGKWDHTSTKAAEVFGNNHCSNLPETLPAQAAAPEEPGSRERLKITDRLW